MSKMDRSEVQMKFLSTFKHHTLLTPRPSVHGPPLVDRERIYVVTTMIVDHVVLGNETHGIGHLHQSHTLMTVHWEAAYKNV